MQYIREKQRSTPLIKGQESKEVQAMRKITSCEEGRSWRSMQYTLQQTVPWRSIKTRTKLTNLASAMAQCCQRNYNFSARHARNKGYSEIITQRFKRIFKTYDNFQKLLINVPASASLIRLWAGPQGNRDQFPFLLLQVVLRTRTCACQICKRL